MAAVRDKLIHGYASVDLGFVWTTVSADLPDLGAQLEELKHDIEEE